MRFDAGNWEIGNLDDVCPSCGCALAKRPGRKAKCPACRKPIYVRTRPLDRQRVLLKEEDVAILERQWDLEGRSLRLPDGANMDALVEELAEHASNGRWGSHRNARMHVAAVHESEFRWQDGFRGILAVCYLDANGPQNRGAAPFVPQDSPTFAPALLERLAHYVDWFALSEEDVHEEFLAGARALWDEIAPPVPPERYWPPLWQALVDLRTSASAR